jgi:hypothetical protein
MLRPRHTSFFICLCWYLTGNAALAEPALAPVDLAGAAAQQKGRPPDLEKARAHFAQGVQFYNSGDYKLSLIEFRRSYELSKNYRILYNIGQVNQQLGNYTNALLALEQYLQTGGEEVDEERKTEVSANILVLRTRVAHIRVITNIEAPEILVDGFPVDTKDPRAKIALDPGDHRVDLRKNGYQSSGTVVALAAGDVSEVRIHLLRVPASVRLAQPVAAPVARGGSTKLWIGWTTTAVTAVGAGVTGVLAAMQANELADLRNSSWSTQAQRDEVGGRAKTLAVVSDVLTLTAIAAGATSIYLTLRSDKVESSQRRTAVSRLAITSGGVRFEQSF